MDKRKAEAVERTIVRLCQTVQRPQELWEQVLKVLRRVVPIDVAFFSTADPATLLFTSASADELLVRLTPQFLENEFLQQDVNQFRSLVRGTSVVTLQEATHNRLESSPRYRDILLPAGLGDELRVALRTNSSCWGFLCLHRDRTSPPFSVAEAALVERLSGHLGAAIGTSVLILETMESPERSAPGVIILSEDNQVIATTGAADYWINQLFEGQAHRSDYLPMPVLAAAAALRASSREPESNPLDARLQARTRSGPWVTVHASWLLKNRNESSIAVIIEPAGQVEIAPLIVCAYNLSSREQEVTRLVMQGLSTVEVSTSLFISANTVQDHLKNIFDKVGVRSRRELVAQIFTRHYQPQLKSNSKNRNPNKLTR